MPYRITPRKEQRNITTQVFSLLANAASVLIVAPTGYGKTVLMGDIAREEIERNGRVLAVVNLQVLLGQTIGTLEHGFQIPTCGFHQSINQYLIGSKSFKIVTDFDRKVLVSMPKTINNAIDKPAENSLEFDLSFEPTMIILDEAHKATSAEYQRIRNRWPNAKIVGFTATPYREKSKPGEYIEEWYGDRIIIAATMLELIERGDLAKPVYQEYKISDDHVAKTWLMVTAGHTNRRTIIFTDDTNHSKQLEKQFLDQGLKVEVVTAGKGKADEEDFVPTQPPKVRDAIFQRFHDGITEIIISVNALCEGFDEKLAKFCFLTRKVGSIAFYQQMCGRVLRKCEGKPEGFIVDFAGNLKVHGRVEAIEWPRAVKGLVLTREDNVISLADYQKRTSVYQECNNCGHLIPLKLTKTCKVCDHSHQVVLEAEINTMVTMALNVDHKRFRDLLPNIREGLRGDLQHQRIVNRKLDITIFENGKLTEQYRFVDDLVTAYNFTIVKKGNIYVGNWEGKFTFAA